MTGAEYRRLVKRLGYSPTIAARRFNIGRMTEYRWRQDGVSGGCEELVRLHVRLQEIERALGLARGGLTVSGRNWDKARDRERMRRQGVETVDGGLDAQVAALTDGKPRKRRSKASVKKQADAAVDDYLRRGGKVTRLPARTRRKKQSAGQRLIEAAKEAASIASSS